MNEMMKYSKNKKDSDFFQKTEIINKKGDKGTFSFKQLIFQMT